MKRPNWAIYLLLSPLVKLFAYFKGQRVIKKTKIVGPAIVLSNHTSFYDFIYTTAALFPHRPTYMASQKMFYEPGTSFFLRISRAIPKCLFQSDPAATMNAFRILKQKGIVAIFPEGQISAIGKTQIPVFSIAKFLRKAKVDVYLVKHHNAYFVNPPWTKKSFSGRIETTKELLIPKENLAKMTEQEIFDHVVNKMAYNASSYNLEKRYSYRLNDITNLESVIYRCPRCGFEGLISEKHQLRCPKCELKLEYDKYGRLGGKGLDELYHSQEKAVQDEISHHENFLISGKVKLESYRKNRLVEVGYGELSLTRTEYQFKGIIDGKPETLTFNPKNIPYLPSDLGINVQIYEDNVIYQFVFEDRKLPTKFIHAGEFIHHLCNQDPLSETV